MRINHPDGTSETFTYNELGQVLTHTDGKGQTTQLLRNGRGLPKWRQDAKGQTITYEYDKANRLKQWANHEYKYDAWGNLVEKIVGIVRWQTFTYDCENRLVKTETMANSQVESTSSYQYDSLGRRVAKQWEIKGQTGQKRFLWQGLRMLREESPEQSSLYLYEPGSYAPLARVDEKEGEVENKVYYFHTDQIGTPLEMTDAEGQIVWQAKYRAWGAVEKLVVNEVEQNLRFQGQYFDVETGLHYNTFRYYDPEIGRFTTQDPIGLDGGLNLYRYAPNPNTWVDPWGWAYKGVDFTGSSDLFPVSGNQKNIVTITMQGSRGRDFTQAYKEAGIKPSAADDYTWHHLDDFDPKTGKTTMQLVTTSAHEATFPHGGSVAQFEKHFGLRSGAYGSADAIGISQNNGWLKGRAPKTTTTTC
ncbi:type IV secretion protein Rhs [Pseudomonas syringae]|nr:type IV secretion protein Rhs [Pseudomonas syringae]